jgi:cytoskeletal protein CcmA (bactofilin family)
MVTDSVPGDAILAGSDVYFSGAAGGDYLGAGGRQTVGGRIHGSVRAAGGEIHVTATVDRNATIAGGNVALDSAGSIARNAYLVGGTVQVTGTVQQTLVADGGAVVLNGVVGRDVEVSSGALRLGPSTRIAGNLRYRVPADKVHIDPGARIAGTVTVLPVQRRSGILRLLWLLGFLLAGGVVVALLPRFAADAAEILTVRPGWSALVGLGWIILVPIAICVLAVTVIGIPLALVTAALFVVLAYLGRATIAIWLGHRILGARARSGRQGVLVDFAVGALILLFVGLIPVLGGLVTGVATVLGLGTILLAAQALRERRQPA